LLTADDMVADQAYFRQKLRRHNRFLHGWGVVCGLEVTAASTEELPWQVQISAGYALGPYGDEIYVAEPILMDMVDCGPGALTDPCEPDMLLGRASGAGVDVFIAIKYAECVAQPVRVMPVSCACEDTSCEYSRIRDSFQIECLSELPASHLVPPQALICELRRMRRLVECPPCPQEPWVVLAQVSLPGSADVALLDTQIDNLVRRQIYSTTMLQDQLIACCCEEDTPPMVGSADLAITNIAQLVPGSAMILSTIDVKNLGPDTAEGVVVTETMSLPDGGLIALYDGIDFSAVNPDWQISASSNAFVANLGNLAAGEKRQLTLSVNNLFGGHVFIGKAVVESATYDPIESNNTAEAQLNFTVE
jgi:hypothetical protein